MLTYCNLFDFDLNSRPLSLRVLVSGCLRFLTLSSFSFASTSSSSISSSLSLPPAPPNSSPSVSSSSSSSCVGCCVRGCELKWVDLGCLRAVGVKEEEEEMKGVVAVGDLEEGDER